MAGCIAIVSVDFKEKIEKDIYSYPLEKTMNTCNPEKNQFCMRKLNFFEIVVFFAGLAVIIVGFFLMYRQYKFDGYVSATLLQSTFLWLILIVMLILASLLENVKEELAIIIREHITETKLLRQETILVKECIKRKR